MENEKNDVAAVDVKTEAIEIPPEAADSAGGTPAPSKPNVILPDETAQNAEALPEAAEPLQPPPSGENTGAGAGQAEVNSANAGAGSEPWADEGRPASPAAAAEAAAPEPGKTSAHQAAAAETAAKPEAPAHNYEAEVNELLEAHPEIRGKSLPDEVFRTCLQTGKTMLSVYDAYLIRTMNDELSRLKTENETLRHNAENALRAPVSAAAESGIPNTPEDPFLSGFYSIG